MQKIQTQHQKEAQNGHDAQKNRQKVARCKARERALKYEQDRGGPFDRLFMDIALDLDSVAQS